MDTPLLPAPTLDWPVLELRRYTLQPGARDEFVDTFDRHFPDAFLQTGAMLVGQFTDRDHPDAFVWLRAFRSMEGRAISNASFYYGPVWAEQKAVMNPRLDDHTDVLLLRPLGAGVRVLPVPRGGAAQMPPATPPAAPVAMLALQLRPDAGPAAQDEAAALFARLGEDVDVQVIGGFGTLDAVNTFPQLPVRSDGPWMAWLAAVRDERALARVEAAAREGAAGLARREALASPLGWRVLCPTARSRARWR